MKNLSALLIILIIALLSCNKESNFNREVQPKANLSISSAKDWFESETSKNKGARINEKNCYIQKCIGNMHLSIHLKTINQNKI
jgi:hypothetical protein